MKKAVLLLILVMFCFIILLIYFIHNKAVEKKENVIIDSTPPIIETKRTKLIIELNQKIDIPNYSATDDVDGNITDKVSVTNNIDSSKEGEYKISYEVKDSSENVATLDVPVIVTNDNVKSVPIITYHNFMTSEEKEKYFSSDKYTMDIKKFETQLIYLRDNGYNSITLDDFYSWYNNEKILSNKDFVLTIDDGNISSYIYAIPLLEKYGFTATIFVITNRITETEQLWDPSKNKFLDTIKINDIKENHESIFLESHTNALHNMKNNVPVISILDDQQLLEDFTISKQILDAEYLAFPYGVNSDNTASLLETAGYKMAFAFGGNNNRRATKNDDQYFIPRININNSTRMSEFISFMEVYE